MLELPADLVSPVGRRQLAGILPDVARSLGASVASTASAELGLAPTRRVCVVLVDGLGLEMLRARKGHAPTLRGMLSDAVPAYAGFPSTTAASLGSFGTGESSGRTGMLGYTVRDERPASRLRSSNPVLNLVSWTASAGGELPDPLAWQPHATVFEQLVAQGIAVTSIGPTRFAGSGLTLAALRGGTYRGADSLEGRVDAALTALREPGLAYLYWGEVDKVGHHEGWSSPEWGEELGVFDAELTRLLRRLPRGSTVVVTADHGMVDVDRRLDIAELALIEGVEVVAGEPRATHLHLVAGADPDTEAARWSDALGDDAFVMTRETAVAGGLFGAVDAVNRGRIGDLVVAARCRSAIVDSRTHTAAGMALVGMHGSLTPDELEIPALVEVR